VLCKVEQGKAYGIISTVTADNSFGMRATFYSSKDDVNNVAKGIGSAPITEQDRGFVPVSGAAYAVISCQGAQGTTFTFDANSIKVYCGEADYQPYICDEYPCDWSTQAGTVYGGTVDVVSGLLTVDRAIVVFDGTESWNYSAYYHCVVCDKRIDDIQINVPVVNYQNNYGIYCRRSSVSSKQIQVGTSTNPIEVVASSADEWKALLQVNPLQVVYELATPLTYQLTPQEVVTLVGENNIFSPDATSIKVVVSNPVIEYVAPQPLTLAEGSNTVSATNLSVSSVPLELNYISKSSSSTPTLQSKTVSPSTSQQTVTADSGYDGLSNVTVSAMPSGTATTPATTITANPTISVSSGGIITASVSGSKSVTPTVSAGYVSSGTAGTVTVSGSNTQQLTTQAAQTIHPSATDQTIASGKYLTGAQTVKGVLLTNLSAGNIKKNVVVKVGDSTDDDCVTSVTGTYEGGGGVASVPESDVNFYDYDGTCVEAYSAEEFANLSALPSNPTHDGLTAQGWNWTLADAKTYVAAHGWLHIGQLYITDDGKTRIYISIPSNAPEAFRLFTIRYRQTVANGVKVDWGDGSDNTYSGTSAANHDHTYASGGNYTITLEAVNGDLYLDSVIWGSSNSATRYKGAYIVKAEIGNVKAISGSCFSQCRCITAVSIPRGVTFSDTSGVFSGCGTLRFATLPPTATSIGSSMFSYCSGLMAVAVPKETTSIGASAFLSCGSLRRVIIPDGATELGNQTFNNNSAMQFVRIPSTVTSIGTQVFTNNFPTMEYHIEPTTPPTLANTNAFTGIVANCKMYVPSASLDAYKTATNWSTYASRMVGE